MVRTFLSFILHFGSLNNIYCIQAPSDIHVIDFSSAAFEFETPVLLVLFETLHIFLRSLFLFHNSRRSMLITHIM